MKKLLTITNFLCLTMQRYGEKTGCANPFNESPLIFSKAGDLYFVRRFFGYFKKKCFLCTHEQN